MIVYKTKHFCRYQENGASVLEVVLAISIVLLSSPFLYSQIKDVSNDVQDIAMANRIVKLRDGVLNYVRVNYSQWDEEIQQQIPVEDLEEIAPMAHTGFIDKYKVKGATITDVYLAFDISNNNYRVTNIVKHIGNDSAIVTDDSIAYSQTWAVSAPEFKTGDLIYKITRDFDGEDKTRYLHRGTFGQDDLNMMKRDLDMNGFNVLNVGKIESESANVSNVNTMYVESDFIDTQNLYFSSGANMNAENVDITTMRITGDVNGFKTITAKYLNDDKFTTVGRVIADRATINNSVNVAKDLILKSESVSSLSGFTGISTNSVSTSFLSATDMVFYDNSGLTISGELLYSSVAPLQIGNWVFPTNVPPAFNKFVLTRAKTPDTPKLDTFKEITKKDWQLTQ